jgi:predicted DNA-binding antitoxin AbrB/MazE fold protein
VRKFNPESRRGKKMKTIKARFSKGKIEPLEKIDMTEGKEISVTIMEVPFKADGDSFARSAGSWKGTIDADKLIENIYSDRLLQTREEPKL